MSKNVWKWFLYIVSFIYNNSCTLRCRMIWTHLIKSTINDFVDGLMVCGFCWFDLWVVWLVFWTYQLWHVYGNMIIQACNSLCHKVGKSIAYLVSLHYTICGSRCHWISSIYCLCSTCQGVDDSLQVKGVSWRLCIIFLKLITYMVYLYVFLTNHLF